MVGRRLIDVWRERERKGKEGREIKRTLKN